MTLDRYTWHAVVLADPKLPNFAKVTAGAIMHRFNPKEGRAWPSMLTLANDTGQCQRVARRGVAALHMAGYLLIERFSKRDSNSYRLTLPEGRATTLEAGFEGTPASPQTYYPEGTPASYLRGRGSPLTEGTPESPEHCITNLVGNIVDIPAKESSLSPSPSSTVPARCAADLTASPDHPPQARQDVILDQRSRPSRQLVAPRLSRQEVEIAFLDWWGAYPRKKGRQGAFKAFARIVEKGTATVAELQAGAERYAAERAGQDPRFTKHASTWLNNGCWADEPDAIPEQPDTGRRGGFSYARAILEAGGHE